MTQLIPVPHGYQDLSDQSQGYFAFRFTCQQCFWSLDTRPIRSSVSTVTNVMDIGVGLLGGFWGRAAESGEKIYGTKWHQEQADALVQAWNEVQHEFRLCPKCHRTVCLRCFNQQLNLCNGDGCAPDLRASGAQYLHEQNIDAQKQQIQQQYVAPQFNVGGLPNAVTPEMLQPPAPPPFQPQAGVFSPQPTPAGVAGPNAASAPGPAVSCPRCQRAGVAGKFCQDCGTKLPLPLRPCPACSAMIESSSRFCSECGART
ncbi:MAG TPA: zinc ribbon domain-containing protein [Ktedonobacteraceae bacterium]|nr:zinc ribbon domain-containing protein [Ktedonobacteraceae bacterium]